MIDETYKILHPVTIHLKILLSSRIPSQYLNIKMYGTTECPTRYRTRHFFNPLNPELNPICYLLALLGAHHFLHVSRIRVKSLNFRLLMSYIYIWSTHS